MILMVITAKIKIEAESIHLMDSNLDCKSLCNTLNIFSSRFSVIILLVVHNRLLYHFKSHMKKKSLYGLYYRERCHVGVCNVYKMISGLGLD